MEYAINIEHAKVSLQGKEILHDINWKVISGAKYFILGANGSGKTTLVRTLLGYIWAHYGAKIEILGQKFWHTDINELRKSIYPNTKMTQVVELSDRDSKAAMIKILQLAITNMI